MRYVRENGDGMLESGSRKSHDNMTWLNKSPLPSWISPRLQLNQNLEIKTMGLAISAWNQTPILPGIPSKIILDVQTDVISVKTAEPFQLV